MRHGLALLALLAVLAASAVLANALAARTEAPGVVWLVTRGDAGLARTLAGTDARLLGVHAGGRLLQLQVPSLAAAHGRQRDTLLQLSLPAAWALPACG